MDVGSYYIGSECGGDGCETLRYENPNGCARVDSYWSESEENSICSDSIDCHFSATERSPMEVCATRGKTQAPIDNKRQIVPLLNISTKSSTTSLHSSPSKLTFVLPEQRQHAFKEWITAKNRSAEQSKMIKKGGDAVRNRQEGVKQWKTEKNKISKNKRSETNCVQNDENSLSSKVNIDCNFKAWLSRKDKELKIEKERVRQEKEINLKRKMEREKLSNVNYAKWMTESSNRSRPVPFGKGLQSLRGATRNLNKNRANWID